MPDGSGYTVVDRTLHRLALGVPAVAQMSFDLEQATRGVDPASVRDGHHVFVAGMARAGTTVLMRQLHDSGAFRSLTYADMPFPLAPGLWARIRGRSVHGETPKERAHGDGITVSTSSPEAFDEVFWRVFDGPAYLKPDRICPHSPDAALIDRFRRYVGTILQTGGKSRYLSKNNANLLRLPALARAFPRATIVVPVRDPLAQAASLWRQHRRFSAVADGFTEDYMGWLGHHEFGPGHRPFTLRSRPPYDPGMLAYWLDQWIRVHTHLLATLPPGAMILRYEALCDDPALWPALSAALELPDPGTPDFRRAPARARAGDVPARLLADARALEEALDDHAFRPGKGAGARDR